jgi:hypothetical protein
MLERFTDRGLPVSVSFNAGVVDAYPQGAEAILEAGRDFVGYGMRQNSLSVARTSASSSQLRSRRSSALPVASRAAGYRRDCARPGTRSTC